MIVVLGTIPCIAVLRIVSRAVVLGTVLRIVLAVVLGTVLRVVLAIVLGMILAVVLRFVLVAVSAVIHDILPPFTLLSRLRRKQHFMLRR